jgi:octaprenyl-diphosphate synthase
MTLPLIYALSQADISTRKKIINIIKNESTNPVKVKDVIHFVKISGGMEYAEKMMIQYQQEALSILHTFPESEARNALENLVYFVTKRKL